jgi:hypothetical protein
MRENQHPEPKRRAPAIVSRDDPTTKFDESLRVMPGLVPGIHAEVYAAAPRGWPGQARP